MQPYRQVTWFLVASVAVHGIAMAEAPRAEATRPTKAVAELAGPFTWGMTPEACLKAFDLDVEARGQKLLKAESNPFKQDAIRVKLADSLTAARASYVKFTGQKNGWDVSLIDREFSHDNDESMLVVSDQRPNQRRFLFFWHEKLYKQFITLDSRFEGMGFDEFSRRLQTTYGTAKAGAVDPDDAFALRFLEWPASGDALLRAYDTKPTTGGYCLSLSQKSVAPLVEKARALKHPRLTPEEMRKQNDKANDNIVNDVLR